MVNNILSYFNDPYFLKIFTKLIEGTITKAEEKDLLYLFKNNAINYKYIDPAYIIIDKLFKKT